MSVDPCHPIIHAAARSVRRHVRRHVRRYAAHYAIAAPVGCAVLTPFVWLAVRPAVGAFAPVPGVVAVPEPNTLALFGASVALAVVVKVWSPKHGR